tara:strand:+ start:3778 stop:4131 length:354 start_codon:yes stop_codon:yes gene_type:complete
MAKRKHIYKVVFHNQGKVYELHAGEISHADMYGFVEVADIIFGERSSLLVDPSEERLKAEFEGVKRTYIPVHAIIRMDEVEKEGTNKIVAGGENGNVTQFPSPIYTPSKPSGDQSSD